MKSKFLLTLPLAAALVVPGWAQQEASSSSSNQTAQTDQSQMPVSQSADKNTEASPNGHQPLVYERHEGFWGHLNPFARKKYVQRQLDPVRGRLNELDEITAQNAKAIKDVDARAQEGIRVASLKANEADMHAVDAGNRAQLANQTAQQATTRLNTVEQVVDNIDQFQPVTQAEIHFKPGQMALSSKAKQAIDELATPLKDQKGYIVEVQGFSPGRGQQAVQNSQQMAQSVVRYLVLKHDIPVYRIYTVAMGNAPAPATAEGTTARHTRGGRVEIALLKNGAGDLSSPEQQTAPTTSNQMNQESMPAQPSPEMNQQQQQPPK